MHGITQSCYGIAPRVGGIGAASTVAPCASRHIQRRSARCSDRTAQAGYTGKLAAQALHISIGKCKSNRRLQRSSHRGSTPCRPVTFEGLPPLPIQAGARVRIDCGYRTLNTTASTGGALQLPRGALLWLERCHFDNFDRAAYPPSVENFHPPDAWYGALVGDAGTLRMVNSTMRWYAHVRVPTLPEVIAPCQLLHNNQPVSARSPRTHTCMCC